MTETGIRTPRTLTPPRILDRIEADSILVRLRSDVLPDSNRLSHPRYAGHQIAATLPAADT